MIDPPVNSVASIAPAAAVFKRGKGRPKGVKNKPKDAEPKVRSKSDMPSEQVLKNIERRTQEVRLAREYGVDPKKLEGMTPAQVKEYFQQVRTALAKAEAGAKAKKKKKKKNILDGKIVAKRLKAKLEKIRKKHGNPLELSINKLQPTKNMIKKASVAKRFKSWLSGRTKDLESRKHAVKHGNYQKTRQAVKDGTMTKQEAKRRGTYHRPKAPTSKAATTATVGMTGVMAASVLPSSHRDTYEAQVKKELEVRS